MNRSSHTRWILALTGSAISMMAACSTTPPATTPPSSSSRLGLHQPRRILGAVDIGRADPNETLELLLSIRRPAGADVDQLIRDQSKPGSTVAFLTPVEFGARFGASADDYNGLIGWCRAHGLTPTTESPSRTTLNVSGTVATVETVFNTRLDQFQDSHGQFRAPAVEPSFDPAFDRVVNGILGLDTAALPHPMSRPPAPGSDANNGSQTPPDLQARYGVDQTGLHGEGQTIAILGAGDPPSLTKDIDPFVNHYKPLVNFDRASQYTQLLLGGPNRDPDTLAQTEYGENVLDIEMAMAMAPQASVVHVITATNSFLFAQGIPYIVNQVPQAHAVSVSYGNCERFADTEIITLDQLFSQAKAQGQQWFFATGDNGTDGCEDNTSNAVLSPGWPTTSIYVMGVGGTSLTAGTEVAWTDGGGGQSEIIDKPSYQTGIGPYPNDGVRDTPDVAALAGSPGVSLYVQGGASPGWQGTSVATPLFASVWALLDQSQGGTGLRNAHEQVYKLGAQGFGFHDIVKGDNSGATPGYDALPGYDLATGWGSPDLPSLIAHWQN